MTRYLCFFMLALCNVKNGCSYVWAFEIAGSKNKAFITTVINVFDRSTLLILGFFLIFLTRWWVVIALFYWTLGAIAWMTIYFIIPESPLWHVMNNRNEQAIAILNKIAEFNGVTERINEETEFTEMQIKVNDP